MESVTEGLYWIAVDHEWRLVAASESFHSHVLQTGDDPDFLSTLMPSHVKDVRSRVKQGILTERSVELLHPAEGGSLSVNYRFFATDDGWFAVGRDQTHQLELVSQMSVLVDDMEREMVQQRELSERLHQLLSNDELTGLPNRRRLRDRLASMWKSYTATDRHFALISVDIDKFKSINDRFGHATGDEVLKAVAGALASSVRGHDTVARFGGEEFIILVDAGDPDLGRAVAERVRAKVEATPMPKEVGTVTVSLGVASTTPVAPADSAELMSLSDQALYAAKHAGRNCVCVHGEY